MAPGTQREPSTTIRRMRKAAPERVAFPGPPAAQPIPGVVAKLSHKLLGRFSFGGTLPTLRPAPRPRRQTTGRARHCIKNVVGSRGVAEPSGCCCPFNAAWLSDACVEGLSALKVTGGGPARTRRGSGLGGVRRSAAAGVRRAMADLVTPPRHSLPGLVLTMVAEARRPEWTSQPGDSCGPLPRANPSHPGPQSPHRLPTGSPDTARLPLSGLADPRLLDCGTGAGNGRGWPSARPPSRGSREVPVSWGLRFSLTVRGWPVVCLTRVVSLVAGRTRRRERFTDCRAAGSAVITRGGLTRRREAPVPRPRLPPRVNQSLILLCPPLHPCALLQRH